MFFTVIPPTRHISPPPNATFMLMQDRWDDYGYQTQYHLSLNQGGEITRFGAVKILRKTQTTADAIQITANFDQLDLQWVSVGQDLDYYKRLSQLGVEQRTVVLRALRDVILLPELESEFSLNPGWGRSLFRDQSQDEMRRFMALASSLIRGDYTAIPSDELEFSFHLNGWDEPLQFKFSQTSITDSDGFSHTDAGLPDRVVALIGSNGSGKSTVLARLARVAYGSVYDRKAEVLSSLGQIAPLGMGFPAIMTVAYSAFDSFTLPGSRPREDAPDEREQIIQDVNRGEGRYIYCGLRDIATELTRRIELEDQGNSANADPANDRVQDTLLKSIGVLADEYAQTLVAVKRNGRERRFLRAMQLIATDPSFSYLKDPSLFDELDKPGEVKNAAFRDHFLSWSTGQKIVAQIVASLTAYMVRGSLVLIDEPESHLHPPLLAALMHAIRYLLDQNKAFAIVATHSPVVLQESLARNVYIMRREGILTKFFSPTIQTFGEALGLLTTEVFGLNSEVTDYHKVLDRLIELLPNLQAIESVLQPHQLSLQARAYVMSRTVDSPGQDNVEAE